MMCAAAGDARNAATAPTSSFRPAPPRRQILSLTVSRDDSSARPFAERTRTEAALRDPRAHLLHVLGGGVRCVEAVVDDAGRDGVGVDPVLGVGLRQRAAQARGRRLGRTLR